MAYSTLATQADTPTAGPDHTYFEAVAGNFSALTDAFGARISSTAAQSSAGGLGTVTYQAVFGTVDWDSSPTLTGTANRLTIPTAWGGVWLVCPAVVAQATTDGIATGSLQLKVRKNGTTDIWDAFYDNGSSGAVAVSLSVPFPVQLVATDYLEVYMVTIHVLTAANAPKLREDLGISLSAVWLSP
jgi:hypothetical protein